MKTRFLLIACLFPVFCFSQSMKYTIKGKVGSYSSPAKMFLTYSYPGQRTVIDSAAIENGSFKFIGTLERPVNATLILKKTAAKIALSRISEALRHQGGECRGIGGCAGPRRGSAWRFEPRGAGR